MALARYASFGWNLLQRMAVQASPRPLGVLPSVQVRTFKDKDVLSLRCKDCYFKKIDQRWWVLCKTSGRHKQREKLEDWKK